VRPGFGGRKAKEASVEAERLGATAVAAGIILGGGWIPVTVEVGEVRVGDAAAVERKEGGVGNEKEADGFE
jgi:hypothetical protein